MEHQDGTFDSALTERKGVEKPSIVNPAAQINPAEFRKRTILSVEDYVKGIIEGNRTILSRAITMIESALPEHQQIAQQIIERCLPYSGKSLRIGITGVPGAGKSTFIEALGSHLVRSGNKLAVLAIDPSSEKTKGSILGDKTRMEELSGMENAFIRPSPSAGSLGGVARKTRETIVLCEAAGFNYVFVETVGVGQSEIAAYRMVDYFLLLQLANTGDELQGIKRGIMEMADGIAINKAEGEFLNKAHLAQAQFRNALHLFPLTESGWVPPVETCSAYTLDGIDRVWEQILEYEKFTKANGYFEKKRQKQSEKILEETIEDQLRFQFYSSNHMEEKIDIARRKINERKASPYTIAQDLVDDYFTSLKS
ncbi:MAG: methylmalonyl Co-A mutase-associated GTPase MeaB [Bacteroidales bacterium]